MCKKLLFSVLFVFLLSLSGSVQGAAINWDNGAGTRDWNTPANWEPDGVPTSADTVNISSGLPEANEPIVYTGTSVNLAQDEYDNSLVISGASGNDTLTIQGDVNTNQLVIVGDYVSGESGKVFMSGGTLTSQNRGLWIGFQCTGTLYMNSGTINLLQQVGTTGNGEFRVGWTYNGDPGVGYVHLAGGVIKCADIWVGEIYPDNPVINKGYIDVNGGMLQVSGVDVPARIALAARIQGYIDGGSIVAYSPSGIGPGITEPNSDPRASFQMDYDWRSDGNTTLTAYKAALTEAYKLQPVAYQRSVDPKPTLTWSPGDKVAYGGLFKGAPSQKYGNGHHVCLSSDVNLVNKDIKGILRSTIGSATGNLGTQDPNNHNIANDANFGNSLKLDTIYYWCVVETNDACAPGGNPDLTGWGGWVEPNLSMWAWKSTVQAFRTLSPKPTLVAPAPSGTTVGIMVGEPLSVLCDWTPGYYAAATNGHHVYFGTNFADVCDANTLDPEYKATTTDSNWIATNLLLGKTYYWRIEEVNTAGPDPCLWSGDTWSFKTGPYRVVDQFSSDTSDSDLRARWKTDSLDTDCSVYGGGAILYYAATGQTGPGMRFAYDNNDRGAGLSSFSEGRLEYASGKNWKYGDGSTTLKALALSYRGAASNQVYPADPNRDRMYVAVEDTNKNIVLVLNEDPNTQQNTAWQEWDIALSDFNNGDVNTAGVKYLYIGFGVRCDPEYGTPGPPGGEGSVLFDDILLYPARCVGMPGYRMLGDLGGTSSGLGDCDVNMADVDVLVNDWLQIDRISGTRQAVAGNDPCLLARWTFEDGYKNDPNGRVGAAANGDVFGPVSIVIDANTPFTAGNHVAYFDQTGEPNAYVECNTWGSDGNFAGKSFTLMCFAKQTELSTETGGWADMITKGEAAQKLEYGFTPLARQVHFATHTFGTTSTALTLGKWYHIAGTYQQLPDANGGYTRVYVDGRLNTEGSTNRAPYRDINERPYMLSHDPTYEPNWCMGALDDEGDPCAVPPTPPGVGHRPFHGYLDDVRVYDRRLTEEEIMYIAGAGPTVQNYYPIAATAIDSDIYSTEAPGSKEVNFKDLAVLAQDWMRQDVLWPEN